MLFPDHYINDSSKRGMIESCLNFNINTPVLILVSMFDCPACERVSRWLPNLLSNDMRIGSFGLIKVYRHEVEYKTFFERLLITAFPS